MDQTGCGENDPNGPVYDPVHGVVHHFYQDHLAAKPGHGPIYGHFVSKDLVNWAQLPVAIWNGLDSSVWPPKVTPYDNMAIFTGSAVVVEGAGPGGKGPGVVNIYPGLCNKQDWPSCRTGTLLAQAVPADYAGDPLLTNWTKPDYNPIIENTQRDPSTPWKTPGGEWRMRTFDSMLYGAASDADLLAGRWYTIGKSDDFRTCECPSFYPLPGPTPGFEDAYHSSAGSLPTHVHKTSCGGDWWQLGSYDPGPRNSTGSFSATAGWEDLFEQRRMDHGGFYASKDNEYPTRSGGKRRINWGWAQVPPQSTQTLPRVVTFNAVARVLEQAPAEELEALRGPPASSRTAVRLAPGVAADLQVGSGVSRHSETVAVFQLPEHNATFGVTVGNLKCTVSYAPPAGEAASKPWYAVQVACGKVSDTLRLVASETTVEVRVFADATFVEAYFQKGRVAMTVSAKLDANSQIAVESTAPVTVSDSRVYPMRSIWVSPQEVRSAPRVFPGALRAAAAAAEEVTLV
jgi:beta-fructofuranosidase